MSSTVLIVGGGGREAALARALSGSALVGKLLVLPGNAQTAAMPKATNLARPPLSDLAGIVALCEAEAVGLVVVGPEEPLAAGLVDRLREAGSHTAVFGPTAAAARIEASKSYAKELMLAAGVPTARHRSFRRGQEGDLVKFLVTEAAFWTGVVVKEDGLAAGKGVMVAESLEEAQEAALRALAKSDGAQVLLEERLEGRELSTMAFVDAQGGVRMMPLAQDHKRLEEGDRGPNTGGMGTVAPVPFPCREERAQLEEQIQETVMRAVVAKMKERDGVVFSGCLFAGLMLTEDGPKVLEFNCRFGDPETQVVLALLRDDLFPILRDIAEGRPVPEAIAWDEDGVWTSVVLVSAGYPGPYDKGLPIDGLGGFTDGPDQRIFHAGTKLDDAGRVVTSGGRVLCVAARAGDLAASAEAATRLASQITFPGVFYREDIGRSLLEDASIATPLTYAASGVSIGEGNRLVELIKPAVKATMRPGCDSVIGGFGSFVDLDRAGFPGGPLLVTGTDGVGTKLRVALDVGRLETVGQDLVAMCVNDVLCHGAEPLSFLDYYATGELGAEEAAAVVRGVARACGEAGCALSGGETAELPGLLANSDFDLAGFVVGALKRPKNPHRLLPMTSLMEPGNLLIGLASSGPHSNGFSLIRRVVERSGLSYSSPCPWDPSQSLGTALLTPTRIYVRDLLPLFRRGFLLGAAHITGGGVTENLPRAMPAHLRARLAQWEWPAVFRWLAEVGQVPEAEMCRTFNLGLGMVLVVEAGRAEEVLELLGERDGLEPRIIGRLEERPTPDSPAVLISEEPAPELPLAPVAPPPAPKRVAVFISGTGKNMEALVKGGQTARSPYSVVLVVSNQPAAPGLLIAQGLGVPTRVVSHKGRSKEAFEAVLDFLCEEAGAELICLAGFMRILSPFFVARWRGRLLNIHPSLLPDFKGATAVADAVAAGATETGATVHFVEEAVDAGQIVLQSQPIPIGKDESASSVSSRLKASVELALYPAALRRVATGQVVYGGEDRAPSGQQGEGQEAETIAAEEDKTTASSCSVQ